MFGDNNSKFKIYWQKSEQGFNEQGFNASLKD